MNNISVYLAGFTMVQVDRDAKAMVKDMRAGLTAFVNNTWCYPRHITVNEKICCWEIEVLGICLTYCVSREFLHRHHCCLHSSMASVTVVILQTQYPDAFIAISGDSNCVNFYSHKTGFTQYADRPTRQNKHWIRVMPTSRRTTVLLHFHFLVNQTTVGLYRWPTYKSCVMRQPATIQSFRKEATYGQRVHRL